VQDRLAPTGITRRGTSPYAAPEESFAEAYNLDYFEIGALDDPQFKITDPRVRIAERAAAAMGGLWGNHAYEAVSIMTYYDDQGDQLTGEHVYTLRLDPPPGRSGRSGP
jgi:hypothetical protein